MRWLVIGVALTGVGCGPVWTGTYGGSLQSVVTCSDNSGGRDPSIERWEVVESQGKLVITGMTWCDSAMAETKGEVATFKLKTCRARDYQFSLTGGTLMRKLGAIAAKFKLSYIALDSPSSCAGDYSGDLLEQ